MDAWQGRLRTAQEICFILFSGLCTIADATTTALGVTSNLTFEINPMVAWRVATPALYTAFEVGWFFITVAAFQTINYIRRRYDIYEPFLWNGYIMVIAVCGIRLLFGIHNVNTIMSALK